MPSFKAILFDLDDTLIDWSNFNADWRTKEARHVQQLYSHILQNGGVINTDVITLQDHLSRRVRDAWASARATLRAPHFGKLIMASLAHFGFVETDDLDMLACINAYRWGAVEGVTVFPDVPQALAILRSHGIKMGIVTNAHQPSTMRDVELAEYDLLQHFPHDGTRICAADVGYLKPHPFIFRHALSVLDVAPEETVFVGDNVVADIDGAQKAKIKAILRINQSEPLLTGVIQPDAKIRNFGELLTVLDDWFPGWR